MLYYLLLFRQRDRVRNNRGGTGGVLFFTPSYNNTHAPAGLWGASWGVGGGSPHPVTHTCKPSIITNTQMHTPTKARLLRYVHTKARCLSPEGVLSEGGPSVPFFTFSLSHGRLLLTGYRWAERPLMLGALLTGSLYFSQWLVIWTVTTRAVCQLAPPWLTHNISLFCVCVCVCVCVWERERWRGRERERERERVCLRTLFMFVGKTPTMKRE